MNLFSEQVLNEIQWSPPKPWVSDPSASVNPFPKQKGFREAIWPTLAPQTEPTALIFK